MLDGFSRRRAAARAGADVDAVRRQLGSENQTTFQ